MRLTWCAFVVFSLSLSADDKVDPKTEMKALEGIWAVTKMEVVGKDATDQGPKSFVIADGKLTGLGPDMAITLDPSKTPKHINLTFKRDGKEFPVRALYELKKDELLVAIPLATPGKPFENKRPTKLESGTAADPVMLITTKRGKP